MKRIYHPVWLWEENEANMWGSVNDRKKAVTQAEALTADHKKYGRFMIRVVSEWKYSCENALTDSNLNKRAWVGHAAVAMALGIPEDVTREAWRNLSSEQQLLANREAERAISLWEYAQESGVSVQEAMDGQVLFL